MKIKMTTTAVDSKLLCYQFGKVFTVGKDIDKTFANNLIASNLAMVIEEDKKEKPKKANSPKKESVKKDEV